jgi:hypothetical protein
LTHEIIICISHGKHGTHGITLRVPFNVKNEKQIYAKKSEREVYIQTKMTTFAMKNENAYL